jgi:Tfp pilus assembly protein PilO
MAAVAAQKSAATSAVSAPKIRVADVYKLAKAMPSTLDMPDILLELDQVAKASGVDLQDISPGTPGADGTISLGMTVEGDFYTITDLLYRLRNLVSVRNGALDASGRLFTIDSLSLGPGAKNGIDASITLHTYEYVPAAPAAAPAAPVVTSTDTTATTTTDTTSSNGPSAAGAQP